MQCNVVVSWWRLFTSLFLDSILQSHWVYLFIKFWRAETEGWPDDDDGETELTRHWIKNSQDGKIFYLFADIGICMRMFEMLLIKTFANGNIEKDIYLLEIEEFAMNKSFNLHGQLDWNVEWRRFVVVAGVKWRAKELDTSASNAVLYNIFQSKGDW